MRLEGWNHIPRGYGATFNTVDAPAWLRVWFRTPFIDRFAYPVMVKRGFGWLTASPDWPTAAREPVAAGWQIRPEPDPPATESGQP